MLVLFEATEVGEDGPTHQPIETLPSLRLIPDLTVMRPADGNETAGAYKHLAFGELVTCKSRREALVEALVGPRT